jgi:histidyl-tRNA synthetase
VNPGVIPWKGKAIMAKKKKTVEARTLKGFQDFLPEDLLPRKKVIQTIEQVFERFGFMPLETPAMEYEEILLGTGGENTNKELFRLESPEGDPIALRFDLTVPFARLLAQYPDRLKLPFRRYALGPVWRADKPAPGRFRQFTQFDIDAAGAAAVAVDAEIIAIMCKVMIALGAPAADLDGRAGFQVLINNRKLIDALLEECGILEAARRKHVLRVIDKLAKAGLKNIELELGSGRIDDSGDPIPGVQLDEAVIARIVEFIGISGATRGEVTDRLEAMLPDSSAAETAIVEMRELAEALDALDVLEEHAVFDPSLARGLDYYTGPVFEMVLPDAPGFGSVMGGGRYDGLVKRFLKQPVPATGMSVGLDRLMAALGHLGILQKSSIPVQVLVVTMGNVPRGESLRLAAELRAAGFRTETFFASKKKMAMSNQLSHADHYGIPVAVILGEDELANGVVSVKDMSAGKEAREDIEDHEEYLKAGKTAQVTVPREKMAGEVHNVLMRVMHPFV